MSRRKKIHRVITNNNASTLCGLPTKSVDVALYDFQTTCPACKEAYAGFCRAIAALATGRQ